MPVAKRKGKARENRTKEDPRTGVSTSGGTNSPGGGKKKKKTYKKRSQRAGGLSLALSLSLSPSLSSLHVFWVIMPSHLKDVFSFIF